MDYIGISRVSFFDFAAFFVMVVLLVSFYMIKHLENIQNNMLKVMLWSHLIVIITDIVDILGPRLSVPYMQQILFGSHLVYYLMHNLTIYAFFFYCCFMVDHYGAGKQVLQILCCVPMIVVVALLATNYWTKWIFHVDASLKYFRGPLVLVIYTVVAFYVIFSLVLIRKYGKKLSGHQRKVAYLYILICVVGALIQYFYPTVVVESFAMAVALVIMFFSTAKLSDYYEDKYNVLNRNAFLYIIENSQNWFGSVTIFVIKIHDFQLYRMTLGKEFQSRLIQAVISYLQSAFPMGTVYHFSNSEFILSFKKYSSQKEMDQVLQQLHERFLGVWQIGDNEIRCSYHIGKFICGREGEITNAEQLRECADYINRHSRSIDHPLLTLKDMEMSVISRTLLVQKLIQEAVEQDGFEMYYQPIYSVKEKCFVSAEALIRLKNKEHGFISPEEFIPIAEQNGMIMKIGEFAFRSVCQFIRSHDLEQYGIRFIEVNLSVVQCMQERLHKQLLSIMEEFGVEPGKINLEITETAEATQMGTFRDNVFVLNQEGVGFSLDDYGTGYSNIGILYQFPFQIVKIDKGLLWGAFENDKAMITLESSVELAKKLNLKVVVEGVETEEQRQKLIGMGCDYLQGYYFSKPLPENDFIRYVKQE